MTTYLDLLDYRRRVFALYAEVRSLRGSNHLGAFERWARVRDELFGSHPQSALEPSQRATFRGLSYFPYDPSLVFLAGVVSDVGEERYEIATSGGESTSFHRFGYVDLPVGRLEVYWLDAYGGGVFLPFRDGTSGHATYGGGRYLLDTVKGADLGSTPDGQLVLDFNFAYHPSCHYSARWSCPLAPPTNWLTVPIPAGERLLP
ncbi:MAG: DUF1684 domain-containing protein [Chloroflexi bacterium]|nr:DUF1684 domain-containing protein [Chloroflexota bacterium]